MKHKIAIIDGEINADALRHPERIVAKQKLYRLKISKSIYQKNSDHATKIAEILEATTSHYEVVNYIILNELYSTTIDLLTGALELCAQDNIDIICLSLGTPLVSDALKLYPIIKQLNKKNIIVISAHSNSGELTFPAAFEEVISVQQDYSNKLLPGEAVLQPFNLHGINVTVNCSGEFWENGKCHIPLRNSFAVPRVVGILNSKKLDEPNLHAVNALNYINRRAAYATNVAVNRQWHEMCKICIILYDAQVQIAEGILQSLNLFWGIQTMGIMLPFNLALPWWICIKKPEYYIDAIDFVQRYCMAEILLTACSENVRIKECVDFDLTIDIREKQRIRLISDSDDVTHRYTNQISGECLSGIIVKSLEAGEIKI